MYKRRQIGSYDIDEESEMTDASDYKRQIEEKNIILKNLKEKIEALNKNIQNKDYLLKKNEKTINRLNEKIKYFEEQTKNYQREFENLKYENEINNKNLGAKLLSKENDNNELKSKIDSKEKENNNLLLMLSSKEKEIKNLKQEINSKIKEIEDLKLCLVSDDKVLANLKNNRLINRITLEEANVTDLMPKYDDEDPLKFYDIIVDINSIKGIINGWDILMNDRGKELLDKSNENDIKIGVIGNGNKGKSFILSKISDIDLPIGDSIKTKGLSIKFPVLEKYKNRNIILLDSAGQETPVLNNEKNMTNTNFKNNKDIIKIGTTPQGNEETIEQEKLTEKSRDKLLTEFFLQNYIVKFSDLLIVVVGILTFSEQKLINKIKKNCSNLKKKNNLIVIHNLQSYVTIKQVHNYIEETLKKSGTFDLKERTFISKERKKEEWIYFYELNSEPKTIHLIFAREKSEAGNFYNQKTIRYLYNVMNTISEKEPLNLYQNIKKFFYELSCEILESPLQSENIILEKNKIKLQNVPNDNELKLKKCLIDELGLNKFSSNGYDPNYCYYTDQKNLHIICEIPGKIDKKSFQVNSNCENGKCFIKITGTKVDDINKFKENNGKFFSKRDFGNFNLDIVLEDVNIETTSGKMQNNNGLIEIIYPIKVNSATLTFE